MKTAKKTKTMKVIETTKYKKIKNEYVDIILTAIATKSPRPIVSSIRLDARLLETDNDTTKQYINNLY